MHASPLHLLAYYFVIVVRRFTLPKVEALHAGSTVVYILHSGHLHWVAVVAWRKELYFFCSLNGMPSELVLAVVRFLFTSPVYREAIMHHMLVIPQVLVECGVRA